jgi:sarcosine oxidase subunit beta
VFFERFAEEFGVDPQFRQYGYLILWPHAALATCRQAVALQQELGVGVLMLAPDDTHRLFPYLRTDDVAAATYSPRDGYADPYTVTTAIAARARALGADIRQQHAVIGLQRVGSRWRVATNAGELEAPHVVLAAGPWTGQLGRLAGLEIPVFPLRRSKFITAPFPVERLPAATPFVIDQVLGFSLRREGPGVLFGYSRKEQQSSFDTAPEWDLVPELVEKVVRRAPVLADAQIMRAWAGLYEMTPDQQGIISAVPGADGLYALAGFSGHGFMHGPIAGQLMAELIADGRAHTVDVSALSLARFARSPAAVEVMTFI